MKRLLVVCWLVGSVSFGYFESPKSGVLKPFDWPAQVMDQEIFDDFRGLDINESIHLIRTKYEIQVVIFYDYPKQEKKNAELTIQNTPQEAAMMEELLKNKESFAEMPKVTAQYLPPRLYNVQKGNRSLSVENPIITVGKNVTKVVLLHEFSHHWYQKKFNPSVYGPENERPEVHPYNQVSGSLEGLRKVAEASAEKLNAINDGKHKVEEVEAAAVKYFEDFIDYEVAFLQAEFQRFREEAVLNRWLYEASDRNGLSPDEKTQRLWYYYLYLKDIRELVEDFKQDKSAQSVTLNLGFLDEKRQQKWKEVKEWTQAMDKVVSSGFEYVANQAIALKWGPAIEQMIEDGTLKLGPGITIKP